LRWLELRPRCGAFWWRGGSSNSFPRVFYILVLLVHCDFLTEHISRRAGRVTWEVYLIRFVPRCGDGLAREFTCSCCIKFLAGERVFAGEVFGASFASFSLYFKSNSPILALRSAMGIRFTLNSIRVRKPCARIAYFALNFLARSVTI
jgi:hypothetical protein